MSEKAIFTGGYQNVRDYAESVDRVLLDLKSGTQPSEETLEPVMQFLDALREEQSASQHVQFLGVLWRRHGQVGKARLARMTSELREHRVGPDTVHDLETLANALDQERAEILQRIRGG
jgi:hypothetical protein